MVLSVVTLPWQFNVNYVLRDAPINQSLKYVTCTCALAQETHKKETNIFLYIIYYILSLVFVLLTYKDNLFYAFIMHLLLLLKGLINLGKINILVPVFSAF